MSALNIYPPYHLLSPHAASPGVEERRTVGTDFPLPFTPTTKIQTNHMLMTFINCTTLVQVLLYLNSCSGRITKKCIFITPDARPRPQIRSRFVKSFIHEIIIISWGWAMAYLSQAKSATALANSTSHIPFSRGRDFLSTSSDLIFFNLMRWWFVCLIFVTAISAMFSNPERMLPVVIDPFSFGLFGYHQHRFHVSN